MTNPGYFITVFNFIILAKFPPLFLFYIAEVWCHANIIIIEHYTEIKAFICDDTSKPF